MAENHNNEYREYDNHPDDPWPEQDESEDPFSDVKKFFDNNEWEEMCPSDRQVALNTYTRYNYMIANGVPLKKPHFMCRDETPVVASTSKAAPRDRKKQHVIDLSAQRISERHTKRMNYKEQRNENAAKRAKTIQESEPPQLADTDNNTESENVTQQQPLLQQPVPRRPLAQILNNGPIPPKGQRPEKIIRTLDQKISYPAPLPTFGTKSLVDLKVPKIERNTRNIMADCKAHIRSLTQDEYLGQKEWDNYCKTIVENYPTLGDDTKVPWAQFKLALQKSFSAQRKYQKKKQLQAQLNHDLPEAVADEPGPAAEGQADQIPEIRDDSTINKEAEEADTALRDESLTRKDMKKLLEDSRDYRESERPKMNPSELLLTYKHLKIPEMMIYDYTLSREISLDEAENKFEENCVLIGNYYKIDSSDDMAKVQILMKAHEFFLSKLVAKGKAKAVLILSEENQHGLRQMNSSDIQAPHIVVLHKKNFITGCDEVRSATLLMHDDIISSLQSPAADKIALLLLAAYHTLNVEYPSAYQQFLRALERLVTGKCLPSKYGQSQVQYTRFISLLQTS